MDPLSSGFWAFEYEEARKALEAIFLRTLEAGVTAGVEMLASFGIAVSWELVNEAVVAYGKQNAAIFAEHLAQSIADELAIALPAWVESGAGLPALMKQLSPLYGQDRAKKIAVTEVTRLFAIGNIDAWSQSGVVKGKKWMVVGDKRTCSICEQIAAKTPIVPLQSDGFEHRDQNGDVMQTYFSPPAHVNCRCAVRPVV